LGSAGLPGVRIFTYGGHMIEFQNLTKTYGGIRAVGGLSLVVQPGEVYALLGPNGAGKTTALRCLATLLAPTSGTAFVGDADVRKQPLVARARIGFLAASMGLYERLTPVELLRYFGQLHRMERPALDARVHELVRIFGITPFMSQRCGTLSTGQAQRVSVARALIHDPPALILDEPTMGLDVLSGEVIYRFIEAERDRGKAIVFSTHHMSEVDLLADRVGVLSGGRLVAEGTPASLIETTGESNLARAFLALVRGAVPAPPAVPEVGETLPEQTF
jgi:sodium transport system ATP-binding protein